MKTMDLLISAYQKRYNLILKKLMDGDNVGRN